MTTTLTYFDFDGSRGLECRLALTVAGVSFEDNRIGRGQWMELKPTMPFGGLPVLTEGDRRVAQSTAILRYAGTQHGMHPTDAWAAAEHDSLMQSVEDFRHKVPGGRGLEEDEKKAKREEFGKGWMTQWANSVADRIQGPFLEGDALNVADLKLYVILRAALSGTYDYVPLTVFDERPELAAFVAAIDADPRVAAYWAERKADG